MSDKAHDKLNPLDLLLRRAYPVGMYQGTDVVIRKLVGFELFNTRPYHNYENWADGYQATDGRVFAMAEDLDDCLNQLAALAQTPDAELQSWQKAPPEFAATWANSFVKRGNL